MFLIRAHEQLKKHVINVKISSQTKKGGKKISQNVCANLLHRDHDHQNGNNNNDGGDKSSLMWYCADDFSTNLAAIAFAFFLLRSVSSSRRKDRAFRERSDFLCMTTGVVPSLSPRFVFFLFFFDGVLLSLPPTLSATAG